MSSTKEKDDELTEQIPRPVEADQVLPLNEEASDPMEDDKSVPAQNEIPSSQTEAPLNNVSQEDKPVPVEDEIPSSQVEEPLNGVSQEVKPVSLQNEVPSSQTEAPRNNVSQEVKPIHEENEIPSSRTEALLNVASHEDKPASVQDDGPSSEAEGHLNDISHTDKLVHAQDEILLSQTKEALNDDNHVDKLIHAQDEILSSQTKVPLNVDNHDEVKSGPPQPQEDSASPAALGVSKNLQKPEIEADANADPEAIGIPNSKTETCVGNGTAISTTHLETTKLTLDAKAEPFEVPDVSRPKEQNEPATPSAVTSNMKSEVSSERELSNGEKKTDVLTPQSNGKSSSKRSFLLEDSHDGSEAGTEEEQLAFMTELHNFFKERSLEFKPPKFYGEGLNCLKLWRTVMRLGGYDKVTTLKLWRQVGESFKPPKTCTTVSWTFRGFYEKALLDYERHKTGSGELNTPIASASNSEPMNVDNQASGSGRARRDAAARAMQGWHSERLLDNGEVSYPVIKDKNSISSQKREKQLKNLGLLKRKKPTYVEDTTKIARTKSSDPQVDVEVVDIGPPADWVKINVQRTKDSYEVYALVPGLLREEVRVQSDPAGRLVISGEPEHPDNPWGVTAFKKVVSLPSRIDPHQTSAVVTLHGQLLVRVPFERSG